MKTPKEILLARHAGAEVELDRVSQGIVSQLQRADKPGTANTINHHARPSLTDAVRTWLWPSPLAWVGLVVVWLVVLAANGRVGDLRGLPVVALRQNEPTQLEAVREQRRLYAELVGDRSETDLRATLPAQNNPQAPSTRPASSGPRSERHPTDSTI